MHKKNNNKMQKKCVDYTAPNANSRGFQQGVSCRLKGDIGITAPDGSAIDMDIFADLTDKAYDECPADVDPRNTNVTYKCFYPSRTYCYDEKANETTAIIGRVEEWPDPRNY